MQSFVKHGINSAAVIRALLLCYSCKAIKQCSLHSLVAGVIIYYTFDICILRCVFSGKPEPRGEAKSAEWTICSP